LEITGFASFAKFQKKTILPEKFEFLDKRGFELMETREKDFCPPANPIHKLSMVSMVWNISMAQLGYPLGCAPSQLPHSCSSTEHGGLEKVLDIIATTENISVINILLVPNPKHSSH